MHNKAYKNLAVQKVFKMPKTTLWFRDADHSDVARQPYPTSVLPSHLRIQRLTSSSVTRLLTGPRLESIRRPLYTESYRPACGEDIPYLANESTFPDLSL